MKIVIASSKNWFYIKSGIESRNDVKLVSKQEELSLEFLTEFNPELIFFPHWNWIVPEEIHSRFTCIVFHTAPLPYGRGGSPIQNLILNNFTDSPVCALKMTSKVDSGPIYSKKNVSLDGPLHIIFERINTVVNKLIEELIEELPVPVDQSGEIHNFERLTETDNELTGEYEINDLYNKIRMLDSPDYPKAFVLIDNYKIEFSNAEVLDEEISADCTFKKLEDS